MSRCECGYKLGEGFFHGCAKCVEHNEKQSRSRRPPIRPDETSDDDFQAPKSQNSIKQRRVVAAPEDVQSTVVAEPEVVVPQQAAPKVVQPTGASLNPSGTLQDANAALAASHWRRCSSREGSNIEHDDFDVIHTPRDGNCLFHCLSAIVWQHELEQEITQVTMRKKIADYWRKNNCNIECASTYGDGSDIVTIPYECENIAAIESGKGGRLAYGEVPEIAVFCKIYNLSVSVFAPEAGAPGDPPLIMNPGKPRAGMLLQTLAWNSKGKRERGRDHWQLLKHKQQAPQDEDVIVVNAPKRPANAMTDTQKQERRAANRAAANQVKAAEAEREVTKVRAFIASGGSFNFEEPGAGEANDTCGEGEGDATDPPGAGEANDTCGDGDVEYTDPPGADEANDTRVDGEGAGAEGREKRKVTHWIHRTRITCLRLIQRMNPFAAKDSGLMWQQIAEQIHRETANVEETNARGKTVNCQVHSNGVALMMWYNRQVQHMEGAYSEVKEKTQSGQTGQMKNAVRKKAEQSGDNEAEIEEEWNVLLSLKALQKDANQAAVLKKLSAGKSKEYKDKVIPDAVLHVACSDQKVEKEAIAELEKRLRKYAQEEQTLTSANRLPVMSSQQIQERDLLAQLKQQRKERIAKDGSLEEDTEMSSDNKGRGKNNLKRSFDMMTEQMTGLSKFLKEETSEQQPTTLQDLQVLLGGIDKDVANGLQLEADERAQLRAMFLRQYAKSRIQVVHHPSGEGGAAK